MSVKNDETGKIYNFSFHKAIAKEDLLTISLGEFRDAFEALDGEMKSMGSNDADEYRFHFNEPELGLIKVAVEMSGQDGYDTRVGFVKEFPANDSEVDRDDAFLMK